MAKAQANVSSATAPAVADVTPITRGKRGKKALPPDPNQAFLQLATGPTGRIQVALDAIANLGKISVATYPNEPGNPAAGRSPVEYTEEHVETIEAVLMKALEDALELLRNRPTSARAARSGFSF